MSPRFASSHSTRLWQNNSIRRYSVKFSENFDGHHPAATKPKISDFKNPLLHTFLLASTCYMSLHALWYSLEYKEVETELHMEASRLEGEMQLALDNAKSEMTSNTKGFFSKIAFWKS